jgi:hypothetical protein
MTSFQKQKLADHREAMETFAHKRGYHISRWDWKTRYVSDVEGVTSEAATVEMLDVYLSPYYSPTHWTSTALIEEGHPYLYHVTDQHNLPDITREGLKPQPDHASQSSQHGFEYPDRIYLFRDRGSVSEYYDALVPMVAHPERGRWLTQTPEAALLLVDLTEVRDGTKFYDDPSFPKLGEALYTYTHIPAVAISVVDRR